MGISNINLIVLQMMYRFLVFNYRDRLLRCLIPTIQSFWLPAVKMGLSIFGIWKMEKRFALLMRIKKFGFN